MKPGLIVLTGCLALTGWSQAAKGASCACTAPDRSCSASIDCVNSCWASCSSGGRCSSGCGGGDDGGLDYQNYSLLNGRAEPFSWSSKEGVSAADLSQRVSEHFGAPFAYVPDDSKEALNVDLKGLSLADLRHFLAQRGAVASADRDLAARWDQADGSPAVRYTVRAANARVARIGEALSRVSSGTFKLVPAEPQGRMTVDIKGVTAADLTLIFAEIEHPIKK
jgi:hypothetical protein